MRSLIQKLRKARRYDDLDTADAILEELQHFRPKQVTDIEMLQGLQDEVKGIRFQK